VDSLKIGKLIGDTRKKMGWTQKMLGDRIGVSDKTVSKWERGIGCPDIDLLTGVAEALGMNVSEVLSGEIVVNENDAGNMKKTKFYVCPVCGNIVTSTSNLVLNCCGKKLVELVAKKETDDVHKMTIERVEDEIFVTMNHEMEKGHYISFIAYLTSDKLIISKLYPEQNAEVRFKPYGHGILYAYCKQDGLWMKRI
jgi:DNA-binding XRE family transcriptional regulator/desulfoferrodoxin (superoxide reductase-like protein)